VGEVKNDMPRRGDIGSAVTFFRLGEHRHWFEAVLAEVEEM